MTWKPEDDNQYIEEQELGIRGMNERHTPGPWNVSQNHSWNIMAESGMVGSACFRGYQANELEKAEVEANARLMAAAPELLESLEAMKKAYEDLWSEMSDDQYGRPNDPAYVRAIGIIAKAVP